MMAAAHRNHAAWWAFALHRLSGVLLALFLPRRPSDPPARSAFFCVAWSLLALAPELGAPLFPWPSGRSASPASELHSLAFAGAPLALLLGWLGARSEGLDATRKKLAVALAGDAKTTLRELLFELRRRMTLGEAPPEGAREAFARFKAGAPAYLDEDATLSSGIPIKPQRLMGELDAALPEDALIFLDVGANTLWATHYLTATGRNAFIHNWGEFAAMGYGVAAAVGGKLAAPGRPVIAVVGDGGFAMAGMEVSTAVTENAPVVWIVLNDARLNAVHHGQTLQYAGRTIGTEFSRMDVAGVAEALGAWSRRVVLPGDIGAAVAAALASGRPAVIDVRVDAAEVPPIHSRVRSLDKLFAGDSR